MTFGVPQSNMHELEALLCENPHGSFAVASFNMTEWLEQSVYVNEIHHAPSSISCEWKNRPLDFNQDAYIATTESPEFFGRLHSDYETFVYTINYKVPENSTNLTILPAWIVNESYYFSNHLVATNVLDSVNDSTTIWYWWSQAYESEFRLASAEIEEHSNSDVSDSTSSTGMIVVGLLVFVAVARRRRRRRKIKKQIKFEIRERKKQQKALKKQAKHGNNQVVIAPIELQNTLPLNQSNSDDSISNVQSTSTTPPIGPPSGESQLIQVTSEIRLDAHGYEWGIDQFDRNVYRVAGSTDNWLIWEE